MWNKESNYIWKNVRHNIPPPAFLPGEFHGWRSLVGCGPWGRKESDTTEQVMHTHTHDIILKDWDWHPHSIIY